MGATSVSGVSGVGSAAGNSKGSSNMSLGVAKLIGPRVVAAGTVAVVAGSGATVTFTVSSGAIAAVTATPAAAGSGYPASSTIYLNVTGGSGTGGIVTATTDGSGVVTAFATTPFAAGSGYSGTTGAATATTGMVWFPTSTTNGDAGELTSGVSYLGFVSDTHQTVAAANVLALTTSYMAVKGTASHTLNWMVVRAGF